MKQVLQAQFFVKTINAAGGYKHSKTLQLMLDLEQNDDQTPDKVWKWVESFLNEIETLTGRPGIIYTGFYFWKDKVSKPNTNLNAPLWLAAYTHPAPIDIPLAWKKDGWTFWQYDDNGAALPGGSPGTIPGIDGSVDVDYFKYGAETLEKYCFP